MALSEIFFSNLTTICSGIILAIIAVLYKSKCKKCNLCFGFIQFERDVEIEEHIDEHRVDMNA